VAAHQKKARRLKAHIVFIDEAGFLTTPLVRRTLAPRGVTPRLVRRGRAREKVSVAAALTLSPARRRLDLSFATLPDGSFDADATAAFVRTLLRRFRGPLIVVWDGGGNHRGPALRELLRRFAGRIFLERLPPYDPDHNPVEHLWSWLKWSTMCNFCPDGPAEIDAAVTGHLSAVRSDQAMLRSFVHGSELPLRLSLAS
jgi:putative transposase